MIGGTLLLFNISGTVYSKRDVPNVVLSSSNMTPWHRAKPMKDTNTEFGGQDKVNFQASWPASILSTRIVGLSCLSILPLQAGLRSVTMDAKLNEV